MILGSSGDIFSEVIVKKKLTTGNYIVRVICGIIAVLLLALLVLGFFIELPGLFIFAVIIWVIEYFIIRFQKIEYEYVFTSGDLDFDQLSGDMKRKRKLSLNFSTMEVIAAEGSHHLAQYEQQNLKTYNFTSRDKSKKYYVYVGSNGDMGRIKVLFEPTEKMLQNMYAYSPSKVKLDD